MANVQTLSQKKRASSLSKDMRRDYQLYLMIIPAAILIIMFMYVPMTGLVIAFKEYRIGQGMYGGSAWVGFQNFTRLFQDMFFVRAFRNTLIIAFMRIIVCLPGAIILSLLLFQAYTKYLRGIVQTLVYIPRFISWVIVAAVTIMFLHPNQGMNSILGDLGAQSITMSNPDQFRYILVAADLWKDVGFNSVLFTAAIMNIDPTLFESAEIDGAHRGHIVWYIILPMIRNTIIVVLVLWVAAIVNVGFDQVFNMINRAVVSTGEIIDTFIFRIAFGSASQNFSLAAAAGLIKSVIAIILLTGAEIFARSIGEKAVFK